MRKTTQEFRRENLKDLFEKTLKARQIKLEPLDISVKESWNNDFTVVELVVNETYSGDQRCREIIEDKAKGFVDGMFKACHSQYAEEHPSLNNIRLVDYQVEPRFNKPNRTMGSDAETEVTIMVEVKDHGVAEFSYISRSILYSSFVATLEAFQFYINCDNAFRKIKSVLEDAQARNRADIEQLCMSELAMLTGVNTYVQKKT
jgi:hypothetical protein